MLRNARMSDNQYVRNVIEHYLLNLLALPVPLRKPDVGYVVYVIITLVFTSCYVICVKIMQFCKRTGKILGSISCIRY